MYGLLDSDVDIEDEITELVVLSRDWSRRELGEETGIAWREGDDVIDVLGVEVVDEAEERLERNMEEKAAVKLER